MVEEGFAGGEGDAEVHAGMESLRHAGAASVLLSRSAAPALALP